MSSSIYARDPISGAYKEIHSVEVSTGIWALQVNSVAGGGGGGNPAAGFTGSPVPASADYAGFNSNGNLVGVSAANPLPVVATIQGAVNGGTAGTTSGLVGGVYRATPITLTDGQQASLLLGPHGALQVGFRGAETANERTVTWTNASALDSVVSVNQRGYANSTFWVTITGSITGGIVTFEVSPDGSIWLPIGVVPIAGIPSQTSTYALVSGNAAWQMFVGGFQLSRIRLSTVIIGTGSVAAGINPSIIGSELVSQSYIYGQTTGGGGGAVAVKVTPSGALTVESTVTGSVALDAATLAALETVNAAVTGTVELGATSLAALETINATVSGTVEIGAASLAALENTTVTVGNAVALDAGTLAALETTTANQGTAGTADWRTDLRRGTTQLFAPISVSTAGDNSLVAADPTKKIKVLHYTIVAEGTVAATFKSGAGTALTGALPLVVNSGVVSPFVAPGHGHLFETTVNQALVLNLSAAVGVRGHLIYILEA